MTPLITNVTVENNPTGKLHVSILSVGQGDGIFIKTPLGRTIMVDCGSTSKESNTLASIGERIFFNDQTGISLDYNTLDFLFVTHPDIDHYNLLFPLFLYSDVEERPAGWPFPLIKRIFYSGDIHREYGDFGASVEGHFLNREAYDQLYPLETYPNRGDIGPQVEMVQLNEDTTVKEPILVLQENVATDLVFKMSILAAGVDFPRSKKRKRDQDMVSSTKDGPVTNAKSIVLLLEFGVDKILLTGDANTPVDHFLRAHFEGKITNLPVLQMPHHGATEHQFSQGLIRKINAQLVVACAPNRGSKHGHPRYLEVKKFAESAEQLADAEDMTPDAGAIENMIYCYATFPEDENKVKKKRRTDTEDADTREVSSEFPKDFTPILVDVFDEETQEYQKFYDPGARGTTARGTVNIPTNLAITGSMLRTVDGEPVYGLNCDLEFDGKPMETT